MTGHIAGGGARPPSAGMYERIVDVAADAIVTINEAQEIVHFNHGAERIFGYSKEEVLGSDLGRLLPMQFRANHANHVVAFGSSSETARLMGHRREVFGLRKDGTEFPAEASILKLDAPDGRRLYTALVRDVTDRRRTDQQHGFLADVSAALSRSLDVDATLESVVHLPVPALADGCMLKAADGSGHTRRLTSWRGGVLPDGFAEDELARQAVPLVARGQAVGELTLLRSKRGRSGDASDVLVTENFAARAALAIDNARLYHAAQQATRARDEVLGVVSHDLRNPLSAITMCSRVLMDSPPADDSARRDLAKTIYESTVWMSRMIQDLLDVSAIEAGVLSLVCHDEDVGPILTRATDLFTRTAAERGVTIVEDIPPSASIHVDAERIVQAVANLVGNAVKFTPRGGTVVIAVRQAGDGMQIAVEDTGRGMAAEEVSHIFDRYWHSRGAGAGAGLGLAIAKGIVEAHGGHIDVTSTSGVGSRFVVVLPARDHATHT